MRTIRELISRTARKGKLLPHALQQKERMEIKRRQLRAKWNIGGKSKKDRAGLNRAIIGKARQIKTRKGKLLPITAKESLVILRHRRNSALLDHLHPSRKDKGHWKRALDRDHGARDEIIDLRQFSFLDNPKGTMEGLRKIAESEAQAPGSRINFQDTYCLDVSPFMLLAECWDEMMPIFKGGIMELPMKKVLATVGLQRELKIDLPGVHEYSDVWAFPIQRRRPVGSSQSPTRQLDVQKREIVADRFCDALDDWLSRPEIGFQLTRDGRGYIKGLLGELLENAERHCDGTRRDGSWAVSGFLARRKADESDDDGGYVYRAHIGIVSLGDTFSQSLERASDTTRRHIGDYISGVRKAGCGVSDETLRTLVAIQDGITCVEEADDDNRGGFGLQDMLEIISFLGGTADPELKPRVTILSGNACIRLRDPYIRGEIKGSTGQRVLWCNRDNTGREPPDENYVFDLSPGIPGTLISIGFSLDPEYFHQIDAGNGETDA